MFAFQSMSINSNAIRETVLFNTKDYSRSTDIKRSQLKEPKSAKANCYMYHYKQSKCLTPALNKLLE